MRILLVNYEYPPIGGGGGVASYEVVKKLSAKHNYIILTSNFGFSLKIETLSNIKIIRVPVLGRKNLYSSTILTLFSFTLLALLIYPFLIINKKIDIVHSHFTIPSGLLGIFIAMTFKLPHVLTVYAGDIFGSDEEDPIVFNKFWNRFAAKISAWVIKKSDSVITISKDSLNSINRYLDIHNKNIQIIPPGVDKPLKVTFKREFIGYSDRDIILCSVCRIVPRKRLNDVIEAISQIGSSRIKYIVVGDGIARKDLEELAVERGIKEHCLFTGRVSEDEKMSYLHMSDIFIMPSSHEGFGISYIEAMVCGLPIIASNCGGQVEFLENEQNGLLVPSGDITEIKHAISKLASDDVLRKKMEENNIEKVKSFSWDSIAERYERIYLECI